MGSDMRRLSRRHGARKLAPCQPHGGKRGQEKRKPGDAGLVETEREGGASGAGWHVARSGIRAAAEEVLLHLAREVLARARIGEVQSVLVHEHGLVLEPAGPGFLAHVLEDALAQVARVGREVESFGFLAELDALDGTGHVDFLVLAEWRREKSRKSALCAPACEGSIDVSGI